MADKIGDQMNNDGTRRKSLQEIEKQVAASTLRSREVRERAKQGKHRRNVQRAVGSLIVALAMVGFLTLVAFVLFLILFR